MYGVYRADSKKSVVQYRKKKPARTCMPEIVLFFKKYFLIESKQNYASHSRPIFVYKYKTYLLKIHHKITGRACSAMDIN